MKKLFLFFAILLVLSVACSSESAQPTPDVTATPTPAAITAIDEAAATLTDIPAPVDTAAPTPVLDPKANLQAAIQTALGTSNRNVQRVKLVGFDTYEAGDIAVEWSINDNLSESLIRFGARKDATTILKTISQSGMKYTTATLQGYFPPQDVNGNSSETMVINLVYQKTTLDQVNWSNFLSDNVYNIADKSYVHFVHPLFEGQ